MKSQEISIVDTEEKMTFDEWLIEGGKAALTLLPMVGVISSLHGSIALKNHIKRSKVFQEEMNQTILDIMRRTKDQVTEAQLQLINGVFIAEYETFSDQKLPFLRNCIKNGLSDRNLHHAEAMAISRVLRDITAEELLFVIEHFDNFQIRSHPEYEALSKEEQSNFQIERGNMFARLISLGLAIPSSGMMSNGRPPRFFSDLAEKVIKITAPAQ